MVKMTNLIDMYVNYLETIKNLKREKSKIEHEIDKCEHYLHRLTMDIIFYTGDDIDEDDTNEENDVLDEAPELKEETVKPVIHAKIKRKTEDKNDNGESKQSDS